MFICVSIYIYSLNTLPFMNFFWIFFSTLCMWVREVGNPAQTLSGPRARAEEVFCRGRIIDGRGVKGNG